MKPENYFFIKKPRENSLVLYTTGQYPIEGKRLKNVSFRAYFLGGIYEKIYGGIYEKKFSSSSSLFTRFHRSC